MTKDISIFSLLLCFLLLIIPIIISLIFKLKIIKSLLFSVFRMSVQLFLIGIFLQVIFKINNIFYNILWLIFMIVVATFSVIKNTDLIFKKFFIPIFISFLITIFFVILYFNIFVINLENFFSAKYLIAAGGMLLGNALRGSIIGISNIFQQIKRNENRYLYYLSLGATKYEALLPYFQQSLLLALKPSIAAMATLGLVHLPGMMTGQMIGGSDPIVAVKYQIAIMVAIFVSVSLNISLGFIFSIQTGFNKLGILKKDIFKKKG